MLSLLVILMGCLHAPRVRLRPRHRGLGRLGMVRSAPAATVVAPMSFATRLAPRLRRSLWRACPRSTSCPRSHRRSCQVLLLAAASLPARGSRNRGLRRLLERLILLVWMLAAAALIGGPPWRAVRAEEAAPAPGGPSGRAAGASSLDPWAVSLARKELQAAHDAAFKEFQSSCMAEMSRISMASMRATLPQTLSKATGPLSKRFDERVAQRMDAFSARL
ncbi:unnamed protein product [Prorocentrum cordatum]|uniref:Uncharacterized protein n=1 Tax=Prorocentrum cordatum TaxID=2364126 RepID=A0ABN9TY53_9DINO|nr:unnamed protein product [Polarella glacialis]